MKNTTLTYSKRKDDKPDRTIQKIKDCLESAGIKCKTDYLQENLEGCYSARVSLEGNLGAVIGTNGKGTTKEYCLASGHAELIERVQNMMFLFQPPYYDSCSPFASGELPDGSQFRKISEEELMSEENALVQRIMKRFTGSVKQKVEYLGADQLVRLQMNRVFPYWESQGVMTVPFYHVQSGKYEWLPLDLLRSLNMSNGMAAGNSLEEALVQGFSEIFERHVQKRIIKEGITPPDIPREELDQFPYIANVIKRIEADGKYHVMIKDCSLGADFPVVCGIVINRETQTFGVRFGSHPDIQIALERVFTEAFQGKQLEEFSRMNHVSYSKQETGCYQNVFNTMKTGVGGYPSELFKRIPTYNYKAWNVGKNMSNREMMDRMIKQFLKENCELYLLDVSYLGFPTVFIFAENMSELMPYDYSVMKINAAKLESISFLCGETEINPEAVEKLLTAGKMIRGSVLENRVEALCQRPFPYEVHGGVDQIGFLCAVCCYYLGNYDEAVKYIRQCIKANPVGSEEYGYLSTVSKLLKAKAEGVSQHQLENMLEALCGLELSNKVLDDFSDVKFVFQRLYPFCERFHCEHCSHTTCIYPELRIFYKNLYDRMKKSDVMTKELHLLIPSNMQGGR